MKLEFKPYRPSKVAVKKIEPIVGVPSGMGHVKTISRAEVEAMYPDPVAILEHKRKLNAERQRRYRAKKAAHDKK